MTIDSWLESAKADAGQRGLPELKPLLDGLAKATRTLREADFGCHPVKAVTEASVQST